MEPVAARALDAFVASAREAFGENLRCLALFGSAAEDRQRATSDLNLVAVLARFDPAAAERLREPLALAWTALRAQIMLVLESELPAAAEAFAVKFADIHRRHRVLAGEDLLAQLQPSRPALSAQLRQSLLGLVLRLREQYVDQGYHEERLVSAIADAAGPLRACAGALLELEGRPAGDPRAALTACVGEIPELSQARETGALPHGRAGTTLLRLLAAAESLLERARNA
jgi:hypothetical protein